MFSVGICFLISGPGETLGETLETEPGGWLEPMSVYRRTDKGCTASRQRIDSQETTKQAPSLEDFNIL